MKPNVSPLMRNHALMIAASLALAACSGSQSTDDAQPTDATQADLLTQCTALSERTQKEANLYATMTLGGAETAEAAFLDFQRTRERWEDEDNVCARDGADVTKRMTVQQMTDAKLEQASAVGTNRILEHLAPNVDASRDFMETLFGASSTLHEDTIATAMDIDRRYRERLLTKFKETGKLGQLDDGLSTTCVFSDKKLDPNAEISNNFQFVFGGTSEVHALCRIPAPADKFGGDAGGQMTIVLDDDDDPSNGVVHRGELGTPEKWGSTQWFSGRFSMPQGAHAQSDTGYYYVWIEAVRPELGNESLVHNHFYWHR